MNKVVIIGCGNVGMSYAYALLNQRTNVNELVLIDINKEKVEGEVLDLNHGLAFAPSKLNIKVGTYEDCSDAKIIVIAAGVNQATNETRINLLNRNADIFKNIVTDVMKTKFDGVFLIATNPVDIMTYLTYKYSKLNSSQVLGTGTSLDTARLRYVIGEKISINPKNIHAYVMGEHGDSEFVPWSNATIGLDSINKYLNTLELNQIALKVKNAAYEIINKKGATYYGIGMCLVRITNAILSDENSIITVSAYDKEKDIYIGLPAIINKKGVDEVLSISLTEEEENKLNYSIDILKEIIDNIKKLN